MYVNKRVELSQRGIALQKIYVLLLLLLLLKLLDSPSSLCNHGDESILHMFWECPKTQDYWLDVENWIHTSFTRCI